MSLTTEAEAAAKRCCGPADCGELRDVDPTKRPVRFCIGSACMAWRWHWQVMPDGTREHIFAADGDCGRLGYCGIPGKP